MIVRAFEAREQPFTDTLQLIHVRHMTFNHPRLTDVPQPHKLPLHPESSRALNLLFICVHIEPQLSKAPRD